jgi:hypothetical protein
MITLKTLHAASLQEIFDQVAKHMLAQNAPAVYINQDGDRNCLYRTFDGRKCAVGCLIADDEYSSAIEDLGMRGLAKVLDPLHFCGTSSYLNTRETQARDAAALRGWSDAGLSQLQYDLLIALQEMHDSYEEETMYKPPQYIFENDLAEVASRFDLTYDRSKYIS